MYTRSLLLALMATGCTVSGGGRDVSTGGTTLTAGGATVTAGSTGDTDGGDPDTGGTDTGGTATGGTGADETTDTDGTSGETGGTGDVKFDVGTDKDIPGAGDGGSNEGCQKVDFLFVVDNSGSMEDEQQNLSASFPGFISTIQNTLQAQDYHIMVVDSDAGGDATCQVFCAQPSAVACGGVLCDDLPPPQTGCEVELGAGRTESKDAADCNVAGGNRYMLDSQPDLNGTFACLAQVGTLGDGNERPMEAAIEAITTHVPPGECNEGFLRDDAILVVTVITDEEDVGKSTGNPQDWVDAMVQAKGGDPNAVVALAIVGDTDLANAQCMPLNVTEGAEGAPRIRQWAESFGYGQWGSVCVADYTPFFEQAVSVIDSACDDFQPPG